MHDPDEHFMALALELAARGRGAVEPNPMVGAVIVRDGVAIARGWHRRFGGPHAEREALAAARRAGRDVRGAAMYVTLEPCCGFPGKKTPPCTEAILAAGIARVVVGMLDPDEKVAGRGAAILREAGVEVTIGVLAEKVRELLAAYVKLRTQHRPWVICKWAQTADGLLALPAGAGRWVSGPESRRRAHKLRGLCDGVLVGVGTVLADDPLLTNRSGKGKQPARVVLDCEGRTPIDSQLVRTAGESPVIVAAARGRCDPRRAASLRGAGVEVLELAPGPGGVDLEALLDEMGSRQWTHLLVEGGAQALESFIEGGLADELLVFLSPKRFADAAAGLARFDIADVRRRLAPTLIEQRTLADDRMERYRWVNPAR